MEKIAWQIWARGEATKLFRIVKREQEPENSRHFGVIVESVPNRTLVRREIGKE
jgi:hypothetical protein